MFQFFCYFVIVVGECICGLSQNISSNITTVTSTSTSVTSTSITNTSITSTSITSIRYSNIPLVDITFHFYCYLIISTTHRDSSGSTACRPSITPGIADTSSSSAAVWYAVSGVLGALLLLSGVVNVVLISILMRKRR